MKYSTSLAPTYPCSYRGPHRTPAGQQNLFAKAVLTPSQQVMFMYTLTKFFITNFSIYQTWASDPLVSSCPDPSTAQSADGSYLTLLCCEQWQDACCRQSFWHCASEFLQCCQNDMWSWNLLTTSLTILPKICCRFTSNSPSSPDLPAIMNLLHTGIFKQRSLHAALLQLYQPCLF